MPTSWRRPGYSSHGRLMSSSRPSRPVRPSWPSTPTSLVVWPSSAGPSSRSRRSNAGRATSACCNESRLAAGAFGARRTPAWGSTCDAQPAALPRRAHAGYRRGATAPRHDAGVVSLRASRHARQASHGSQYRTASEAAAGRVYGGLLTTPARGMPGCGHQTGCGAAPRNLFSAVSSASSSALVLVVPTDPPTSSDRRTRASISGLAKRGRRSRKRAAGGLRQPPRSRGGADGYLTE